MNPVRHLASFEMRWACSALGAIYPRPIGDNPSIGILDLDLSTFLKATMLNVPTEPAIGLRLAIWICALAPIFIVGKWKTISELEVSDRARVIDTLLAHHGYAIRQLVVTLKALGALFYASSQQVRESALASREPVQLISLTKSRGQGVSDVRRSVA